MSNRVGLYPFVDWYPHPAEEAAVLVYSIETDELGVRVLAQVSGDGALA